LTSNDQYFNLLTVISVVSEQCLKATISKILGLGIIAGSVMGKCTVRLYRLFYLFGVQGLDLLTDQSVL